MTLFSKKNRYGLVGASLRECTGNVQNPGRGWYRVYTFTLRGGFGCELPPVFYGGETLALVMINIGAYREDPIDREGILLIKKILSSFAEAGVDMLLRVVYDTQGKGMEHEPTTFNRVLGHIDQVGALLPEYADHILLFQGMFVGSWGEMHTSKFLSEKQLRQMTEKFLEVTEGRIRLAFRTPALLRKIVGEGETLRRDIGFFDDAMLASETHLGTFGTLRRAEAGWTQPWCIDDESPFLEEASRRVPFGGEVLNSAEVLTEGETLERLKSLRVSYLNCIHDATCLEKWKGISGPGGVSFYDYVGAHLGYRFVVEKAAIEGKGKKCCLQLWIANKGFAGCTEDLELVLYVGEAEAHVTVMEKGSLPGGEQKIWGIPVKEEWLGGGCPVFVSLRTRGGGRIVRFANEGADESLFLGQIDSVRRVDQ